MSHSTTLQRSREHASNHLPAPPDTLQLTLHTRRTALPDRIAMRLGLWLIIWSTRTPRPAPTPPEHARLRAHALERSRREHDAARRALLSPRGA